MIERLTSFTRRLTYQPEVKAIARWLGLRKPLRRVYYRLARPANGIIDFRVGQLNGRYHVDSAYEMRNLDSAGRGQQEGGILETLVSAVQQGDVILDVGANVGLYTILLAKAAGVQGRVIACEPQRQSFERLLGNISLNRLQNVRAHDVALGAESGSALLFWGSGNADSSLMGPPTGRDVGHERVRIVSGDELLAAERLGVPRIIKVDVEGSEFAVLRGLRSTLESRACEILCCEIHPQVLPSGVTASRIQDYVCQRGLDSQQLKRRYDTYHLLARRNQPKAQSHEESATRNQ